MLNEDLCWKALTQTGWRWWRTPIEWEKRDDLLVWEWLINNRSSARVRWLHFLLWDSVTVFTLPLDCTESTFTLTSWEKCGHLPDCPLKQFFLVSGSGFDQGKSDTLLKWSTLSISWTFSHKIHFISYRELGISPDTIQRIHAALIAEVSSKTLATLSGQHDIPSSSSRNPDSSRSGWCYPWRRVASF